MTELILRDHPQLVRQIYKTLGFNICCLSDSTPELSTVTFKTQDVNEVIDFGNYNDVICRVFALFYEEYPQLVIALRSVFQTRPGEFGVVGKLSPLQHVNHDKNRNKHTKDQITK